MKRLPSLCVLSSCVHILSAIACEYDLDICQCSVDQAFVQSDLEEVFFFLDCRRDVVIFRKGNSSQQKSVRIEASLPYMTCSSNDVSQKMVSSSL